MALTLHINYLGFQSLFHSLSNAQQKAALLIDETDAVILATPTAHTLLGYSGVQLLNLPLHAIIPNLDSRLLGQQFNFISTNQYFISNKNKLVVLTQDGRALSINADIATLTAPSPPFVIIIHHDERRRVEVSLQKNEERLNLAKHAAGLGLYDRDLNNNSLYWDERSHELLGVSADEEITYEKFEACIHPDDLEHRREVLLQALDPQGNGQYQTEFRIYRKNDGSERWIFSAGQISFEGGQPVRLLGLMRDITELKAIEHQSHKRHSETESLLKQQIAMHTASAIAHEINQPLAAISAYSEVALHSLQNNHINSESLYRALEGCVTQAQRAGDTLHELMNFLNQRELIVEPADINHLIKASIEIAKKDGYSGFKPLLQSEKKLPPVLCSPLQVQKVILNLLRNAIDAVQGADVTAAHITIKVKKDETSNMALVTVQDNGPGFDVEAAKRIFKPFFTSKRKGIGMGLVISRSLIEANGGTLWHDPDATGGAIIHFTLPFAT